MDCKTERRFAKKDLSELCEYLGIPEKITLVQRTVCGGMEGPCILLKRLVYLVNTQAWYPALAVTDRALLNLQHYDRFYLR